MRFLNPAAQGALAMTAAGLSPKENRVGTWGFLICLDLPSSFVPPLFV
jgi:hypothetical protein